MDDSEQSTRQRQRQSPFQPTHKKWRWVEDLWSSSWKKRKLSWFMGGENGETTNESRSNLQDEDEDSVNSDDDHHYSNGMAWNVFVSGCLWILCMMGEITNNAFLTYCGLGSVLFGLPPILQKAYIRIRYNYHHRNQYGYWHVLHSLDANVMMAIAAIGAMCIHEFEEAASVSFLFSVSETLEARASARARHALSAILALKPNRAHVVQFQQQEENQNNVNQNHHDDNNNQVSSRTENTNSVGERATAPSLHTNHSISVMPAELVPVGATLCVRTGDKIAADGIVVQGHSFLDQSSLTGESIPVPVKIGDIVMGGSINIGNTVLWIQTTARSQDSSISRLVALVEQAQMNRSETEKTIDAFARVYTPVILITAVILATVPWILWGREQGRHWILNALILVVIACPCALTISTPVTYAAALAATAQRGIICKGGASLEAMGSVSHVVLDKTGTLTEGKFSVVAISEVILSTEQDQQQQYSRSEMLQLLAAMEAPSSHPLSATLVQAAHREMIMDDALPSLDVQDHTVLKGEGVTAYVNGKQVYVGNRRLFERVSMYAQIPDRYKIMTDRWSDEQGGTVGFIGVQGIGIIGCYCMKDQVRPESKETVNALLSDGVRVIMLTGDGDGAARTVAQQVGLPSSAVHSQLLPEDKLHFIGSLKSPCNNANTLACGLLRRRNQILFCGDGVNDAPALAVADIGVSMGEGAALAMEMSDVTLMDSNLSKLLYVIHMGSRVLHTIRENIILSLLCKVAVVALTFGGYMTLLYAIAADVGVMLLVTINGLKLLPQTNEEVDYFSLSKEKNRRAPTRVRSWKTYVGLPAEEDRMI
jgi:Cd2+/Zn2+-exporting ATPase